MRGAHGVLVTAVSRTAFERAIGMLHTRGTMTLVGSPPGNLDLPIFDVVLNAKTVRGSIVGTRKDFQEALAFASEGEVSAHYTTDRIDNINSIFDQMRGREILQRSVQRHLGQAPECSQQLCLLWIDLQFGKQNRYLEMDFAHTDGDRQDIGLNLCLLRHAVAGGQHGVLGRRHIGNRNIGACHLQTACQGGLAVVESEVQLDQRFGGWVPTSGHSTLWSARRMWRKRGRIAGVIFGAERSRRLSALPRSR